MDKKKTNTEKHFTEETPTRNGESPDHKGPLNRKALVLSPLHKVQGDILEARLNSLIRRDRSRFTLGKLYREFSKQDLSTGLFHFRFYRRRIDTLFSVLVALITSFGCFYLGFTEATPQESFPVCLLLSVILHFMATKASEKRLRRTYREFISIGMSNFYEVFTPEKISEAQERGYFNREDVEEFLLREKMENQFI